MAKLNQTQKVVVIIILVGLVFGFCCAPWYVLDISPDEVNWKALLNVSGEDLAEIWGVLWEPTNRDNQAPRQSISGPHPDGIYTVGTEISTGTWESQGTGDRCYWAIRDRNQETTKNYFGKAGGNVTLKSSHYEFFSERCGTWYLK